jgi:aminobenzoyl-glutamate utilization protein B
MAGVFSNDAKDYAHDAILANHDAFVTLNDALFYFGELGMQEFRSAGLMTGILEEHGFTVERGIAGFPTGFMASYGSGGPVIALHSEYDALPGKSQKSGVAALEEITPGAPGHCEGHNTNGAVLVTAGLAVRYAMERFGLKGTVKVFGAPAEEQVVSRPYFVRDGYFDDVDIAFHDHISDEFKTIYGLTQSANIVATFHFHGEAAHAATEPWLGRDALDAVVLMDVGMAQFREHMRPELRAHRVVRDGGVQTNIIPQHASIQWGFRAPTATGVRELLAAAERMAQGAALMTRCTTSRVVDAAVWPVRTNRTLAEVTDTNIARIGMPAWTEAEVAFARAVQKAAGKPEDGLRAAATKLTGPSPQIAASNDCGDISWKVPMGRISFPGNLPHAAFHHWSAGAALATTIAHKGGLVGASAMATTVLDFLLNPALVEAAKASFREELDDMVYEPMLPKDQPPPLELNAATMAKYRPAMEAHYVTATPRFAF